MSIEERRLPVQQLQPGMFVSRIDVAWSATPFPLQGLRIEGRADIEALAQFTRECVVDLRLSTPVGPRNPLQTLGYRPPAGGAVPMPRDYGAPVPVQDELPRARAAQSASSALLKRLHADLRAGRALERDQLAAAVEPVVSSVLRSPDAYFWLDVLRRRDPYAYGHALNCAALVSALGRQVGLPAVELVELAGAALLMDIGMALLPDGLCNHGLLLKPHERLQMQGHVALGLEQLAESAGVSELQRSWIASHHERHDGSGYPQGLVGLEIPLEARMLGIADTFDALCSDRAHQRARSRHEAAQLLYRERDRLFQADLVEHFGQALGVYPTGCLVELSTGEVAVVSQQNAARRLYPRVTVLTHPDKRLDPAFPVLDLWLDTLPDGSRRSIQRALPPGAFGLDLGQLFIAG